MSRKRLAAAVGASALVHAAAGAALMLAGREFVPPLRSAEPAAAQRLAAPMRVRLMGPAAGGARGGAQAGEGGTARALEPAASGHVVDRVVAAGSFAAAAAEPAARERPVSSADPAPVVGAAPSAPAAIDAHPAPAAGAAPSAPAAIDAQTTGAAAPGGSAAPGSGRTGSGALAGPAGSSAPGGSRSGAGSGREPSAAEVLQRRLAESARRCYPKAAARFRLVGEVGISFGLDGAGGLATLSLLGSTGSSILDRAAEECVVQGALPLPVAAGARYSVPVRFAPE